ncbi:serine/threonine-protein kinase [Nocardioides ferulae]|uniref:serine/threonine-protein kinase n=1 Tax=Nocardioides ferulae TaxID=2340821 RepID=UPI000EACF510|nr:serine/threonine-protein kinase [Nocardioides ferulae]
MPEPPVAGRYRLEREIGRGGMGSVWLALDERLGREVALKEVGRLPGESGHDVARALREARSAAALSHPHLVSVYDVVEEPDRAWLVMEYVPGPTLAQLTAELGPLPAERVARIGAQVAGGLAAAHERGTVHRDVKPGNIMVVTGTSEGQAGRDVAKVGDFGIARTQGDSQLTRTGLVTGTPAYFSPELARGEEPTPAADVWALGATLFAAVEGRPPYPDQGNALALLATIASQQPPRPSVGGALGEALTRMLDPDPASRWSMRRAAEALEAAASGAPGGDATLVAAPVDPPTEAFAAQPVEPATPAEPAPAGPPPEGRRRGPWVVVALVAALLLVGALAYASLGDGDQDDAPSAGATPGERETKATEPPSESPPTEEPEPVEETESADDPEESEETTEGNGAPTTGSRMDFVESYYALLPGDTDTAWTWLSPPMQDQAGGPEGYAGFWGTVESVTVDDTRPSGPDGVEVDLTYVTADGSESETRLIETEKTGDGYRIVGDQVVG